MIRTAIASLALMAVCASAPLTARQQARDTAKAATGTGVIAGTITTDEAQPRPLRRATVELIAGALALPQIVVTDDAGRYAFRNLPAGNYTVTARRPGYVRAFYGSKRSIDPPGVPIAVVEGTPNTNIDLRLIRGGVITGMVRYPSGQPATGINVQVLRVETVNGQRRLAVGGVAEMTGQIQSDDRGVYRAYGLGPGEYVVMLRPARSFGVDSARRVTAEEIAWADRAFAGPKTMVAGGSTELPPPPIAGQSVTFATVYHPGTTRAADAVPVVLAKSEERSGIDLTMDLVATSSVSGTVYDPDGKPMPQANVSIAPVMTDQLDLASAVLGRAAARTGPDGTFTVTNVSPGEYTVSVRANAPGQKPQTPAGSASAADFALLAMSGSTGGAGSLWATDTVSVSGRDINGVTLRLAKGMSMTGRVVFESTSKPAADASRLRMMLLPYRAGGSVVDMAASMMTGMAAGGAISDGTFTISNIVPGRYLLNILAPGLVAMPGLPGGDWMLKSAMVNGRDTADLPFEVKAGEDLADVVLTFSDRTSEISGTVIDQAGRPTPAFPIVVFSTNRETWTMSSRRVQRARPATDGKYTIAGLPPGEYFLAAAFELNEERLYDPAFLEQLAAGSIVIKLAEGQKLAQDLKLGGGY